MEYPKGSYFKRIGSLAEIESKSWKCVLCLSSIWITIISVCFPCDCCLSCLACILIFAPIIWFSIWLSLVITALLLIILNGYYFIIGAVLGPSMPLLILPMMISIAIMAISIIVSCILLNWHCLPVHIWITHRYICSHLCYGCCVHFHKGSSIFVSRKEFIDYFKKLVRTKPSDGYFEVTCYSYRDNHRINSWNHKFHLRVKEWKDESISPTLEKTGFVSLHLRRSIEIEQEQRIEEIKNEITEKNKFRDSYCDTVFHPPSLKECKLELNDEKSRIISDGDGINFYNNKVNFEVEEGEGEEEEEEEMDFEISQELENLERMMFPNVCCNCFHLLLCCCYLGNYLKARIPSKFSIIEDVKIKKIITSFEIVEEEDSDYSFMKNKSQTNADDIPLEDFQGIDQEAMLGEQEAMMAMGGDNFPQQQNMMMMPSVVGKEQVESEFPQVQHVEDDNKSSDSSDSLEDETVY